MKQIITAGCLTLAVLLMGMGRIEIINDDFKNVTIVELKVNKGSDEMPKSLSGQFTFTREIKKDGKGPLMITFKLDMSSQFSDVEKKFYLKTDAGPHEMAIQKFKREKRIKSDLLHSSDRKVTTITVAVPAQIENEIAKSNLLVMRVYLASQTVTYSMSKGQVDDIKKLMNTVPVKK